MKKEEKNKEVKLESIKNGETPLLKEMVGARLITEQGLKVQGQGIIINKLDKIIELLEER